MPPLRALLAVPLLIGVAAAILWPSGAAPAAAQSTGPVAACFEITVGWRICAAPVVAAAERAAAQSTGPVAACFEITAGWRICAAPAAATAERAAAQTPGPCATGRAVPDAANNPGLVADCTALLTAKDTLRGTAPLNWDAGLMITAWDGVTVRGTPPRVTELRLGERGLTGTIPAVLGDPPRLTTLRLAQNRLTGCLPRELTQVRHNDLDQLSLDPCELPSTTLTYGAPSTTGTITDDGDYAFLTDPDDLTTMVTTYDGLRDGLREGNPIGLVMHQNDISGASQADFYDLVEAGDIVEWREAADCWVRYHVDEVHADPAGDPPRTLLTIQAYSHAFTGCTSGPITTTGTRTFTWTPEIIRTGNITVPFYHGASLIAPEGWTGPLPDLERVAPIAPAWPPEPLPAPDLGPGWSGSVNASGPDYAYALFVEYRHESGGGLGGMIRRLPVWPSDVSFHTNTPADQQRTHEWILIDGRPAEVTRWHHDTEGAPIERVRVSFYDAATGVLYGFSGGHQPPTNDPEILIELARQFLPDAHPSACRPRRPAGEPSNDDADPALEDCGLPELTLAYDGPPSRTGSVTDAGDYAFLADPNDLTSAITTYEGLRDGLREGNPIGLLLHQNDDSGISHAAFYDLVRVGDLVQWWPASRCWVRYQVTEVHPDPPGAPPRKLLTIQVYSYAFQGTDRCSGTITVTDDRPRQLFDWSPWVIRTGPLPGAFYHGPFLIVPEGWTGLLPGPADVTPIDTPWPPDPLPAPDLGPGWTGGVTAGNAHYSWRAGDALFVSYRHESGGRLEGTIYRLPVWPRGIYSHADIPFPDEYREWILIDGRPAEVTYELDGEPRDDARVSFYDAATGVFYTFWSGYQPPANDPAVLIEIALQFLPDAP